MIRAIDFYHVVEATVPLYVAMMVAYICVRRFKLFTAEQCGGINKFVAKFSVPLLAFKFISQNNPYKMSLKLIYADFLQKVLALLGLVAAAKLLRGGRGGLKFVITGFSLSTLPNTLILGIPVLKAMYGSESGTLLTQIVMLQSLIWNNVLLFLFELNAAKQASEVMPADAQPDQESEAMDQLEEGTGENRREKPKTMYILMAVGKKLILNPNTHAALFGLIFSCITFRWEVKLPKIIQGSIDILADGGLGMAMFSLGLFMASGGRIVACGIRTAMVAMAVRFLVGPALMAAPSLALRLKGTLLRVAIVQAALPQGIVPFVFAKEYNVHPYILSTGVLFGMLVAVPVSLLYYLLLGL